MDRPDDIWEQLQREAVAAHERGTLWTDFWPTVRDRLGELEPHDRGRYRRRFAKLLHLVVSGDHAGQHPPNWESDDA